METYGYTGKILRVNLTSMTSRSEDLDPELARSYLGGRGFNAALLSRELEPGTEPLGEANKLFFMTGPATGSGPGSGKHCVGARSPATGLIGFSTAGGYFGVELKKAGYDGIIIEGTSPKPVYLAIHDDSVRFADASHLWGKLTDECEDMIKRELGDSRFRVSSIGPAGENLVKFAAIVNDKHEVAARTGLGAVAGSKKLKAIAVSGTNRLKIRHEDEYTRIAEAMSRGLEKMEKFKKFGTSMAVGESLRYGLLPVKNFRAGHMDSFAGYEERLEEMVVAERYHHLCPMRCQKLCDLDGRLLERPEYETIFALGSLLANDDIGGMIEANYLCNTLGLDSISCGVVLAFAFECGEKGLPPPSYGVDLGWGQSSNINRLIRMIAYRHGIGDILAEGVKSASEKIGAPELAMQIKGLEMPGYDPRGIYSMGLGYATANRGGCHIEAYSMAPVLWNPAPAAPDRFDAGQKCAELIIELQNLKCIIDSLVHCSFPRHAFRDPAAITGVDLGRYQGLVAAVVGDGPYYCGDSAFGEMGARIFNAEKEFNIRNGLKKVDYTLPSRFTHEALLEGPSKGRKVPLQELLDLYFSKRGWSW